MIENVYFHSHVIFRPPKIFCFFFYLANDGLKF